MAGSLLPLGKGDLIEFQYTPTYAYAPGYFKVKFYSGYVGEFTGRIYNTIVLFVDSGDPDFGKIIVVIIRLSRLGWAREQIAEVVGTSQGRVAQIINNTIFGEINNLLSQGWDMSYIAGHYQMDLALARALRLVGKTDQEKFKELGWGLRTWDQWNFNICIFLNFELFYLIVKKQIPLNFSVFSLVITNFYDKFIPATSFTILDVIPRRKATRSLIAKQIFKYFCPSVEMISVVVLF